MLFNLGHMNACVSPRASSRSRSRQVGLLTICVESYHDTVGLCGSFIVVRFVSGGLPTYNCLPWVYRDKLAARNGCSGA
jgi:hypothetical protein